MKLFLLIGTLVVAVVVGGYLYLVNGLRQEALMGTYSSFFNGIVSRAIQLDRLGEMGVPRVGKNRRNDYPIFMGDAIQEARKFYQSGDDITCESLNVKLEAINLTEFDPTIGILSSYRPLRYVVLFHGKIPEISGFLDSKSNESLLGLVLRFGDSIAEYGDGGRLLNGVDLSRDFAIIERSHPDGIAWNSFECDGFSYIEFMEK